MKLFERDEQTITLISEEYEKSELDWTIGYSGGKDSTALLKLVYNALKHIRNHNKIVNVIYCDTGVEIPIVKSYVEKTFKKLKKESRENNIPLRFKIVAPILEDKFFVKVIGRGYPPPTNKFRWCTDRLKVKPIQKILNESIKENIVLLGVRKGESKERDKIILKHYLEDIYYFKQSNFSKTRIFSPVLHYSTADIWASILKLKNPVGIDGRFLQSLYLIVQGDSEFNFGDTTHKEGRLGCWTCTVVRKDNAVKNLIDGGYTELKPLLEFRNWLYTIRDLENYRCKYRRNGQSGKGPFTLEARNEILDKLLSAQTKSGIDLILAKEIDYIYKLWNIDKFSRKYNE